ncbi:hypothetical protein ABPG73_002942 [Tetrahymena malaccensis]
MIVRISKLNRLNTKDSKELVSNNIFNLAKYKLRINKLKNKHLSYDLSVNVCISVNLLITIEEKTLNKSQEQKIRGIQIVNIKMNNEIANARTQKQNRIQLKQFKSFKTIVERILQHYMNYPSLIISGGI